MHSFPNTMWIVLALWVALAVAGLGLGATVIVSARMQSFQEAYQLGAIVVVPVVALVVAQSAGVMCFSLGLVVLLGVVLGGAGNSLNGMRWQRDCSVRGEAQKNELQAACNECRDGATTMNPMGTGNLSGKLFTKAGCVMLTIISVSLVGVLVLAGVLLAWSPGKPEPFLDENGTLLAGSLSEKIRIPINGVEQGMFIKSKDTNNPVLLFVHGGPGMPEYWLTQRYSTSLEDHFTVVWWEQRGAGLSYNRDVPPETMTAEQFVSDTLEVTDYLRQRFGKEKIYLMAHSWGSYIGVQAAVRAPELYYAYIGMGQISHQIQSEQLAYQYALEQYKKNGNIKMVRKLEAAPPTMTVPLPARYDALRDEYMHGIGIGTTRDMKSVVTGIFIQSWQFREYTFGEKVNLWRGKFFSRSREFNLWDQMQATDLAQQVAEFEIPVYFFHGKYDYTCAYPLAKDYFEKLKAPLKGFYTFEQSAHSPLFEEPEKVVKIFQEDVLTRTNNLADIR